MDSKSDGPIDAVITWVNGNRPEHRQARRTYMAQALNPLNENATNPHRWESAGEILYCLQSIARYAPWVRTIWIVVDEAAPDLSSLGAEIRDKVKIAYHFDIFGEFSKVLPTFNSLSIESMIWRIDGLSDRFLYFNDDVFLASDLEQTDVFHGAASVLRGRWVDYSALLQGPDQSADPALFNHFMQVNAARLAGFDADRLFNSAHVVHPMRRAVMAQLFDQHAEAFLDNIRYRFRDLAQFLPQGLYNHTCIAAGNAVIQTQKDHLHVKSGQGIGRDPDETWSLLQTVAAPGIKFLCVNDLPQLEALIPNVRDWLRSVVGHPA